MNDNALRLLNCNVFASSTVMIIVADICENELLFEKPVIVLYSAAMLLCFANTIANPKLIRLFLECEMYFED